MTASPIALESDQVFPRLKEFLIGSTGLAYYVNRDSELAYRIGRRLSQLGLGDCREYLELLQASPAGGGELDALVGEIAIGETYFFRHEEQFEALRCHVLPAIIEKNRSRRQLSVWSAGCANGAELYSLSILLRNEFADSLKGWQLSLLGTDINRGALARARQGEFDDSTLRCTSESMKRSCFSQAGKFWKIAPRYQEDVAFEYHNLARHPFSALPANNPRFDLILCRNVTIYFSEELTSQIARQLGDCLVEGGWLVVGHAELNANVSNGLEALNVAGTTIYRKSVSGLPLQRLAARALFAAAITSPPQPEVPVEPASAFRPQPVPADFPLRSAEYAPVRARISNTELLDLRVLLDRGEWGKAERECERMLKRDSLNALAHFYHALISGQRALPAEQERALRRVIYLDRTFVLAHHHLGLFLQQERPLEASRCFENVLRICARLPDDVALADGDGITAAELRESARMQLEIVNPA